MYCHSCGKQIPDGAAFCPSCGARQNLQAAPEPAPRYEAPQGGPRYNAPQSAQRQAAPARPASKKVWPVVLAVVVVFLLVMAGLGRAYLVPKSGAGSAASQPVMSIPPLTLDDVLVTPDRQSIPVSPQYTELFSGTGVTHQPSMPGMDMKSFAAKDDNGSVICRDFGYRDDLVLRYDETWYIFNVPDGSDRCRDLTADAESEVARYSAYSFVTVSYDYDAQSQRFTMRYVFTDLDQPENAQAIYDLGVADDPGGLSMARCEEQLQAQGYYTR